MTKSPHIILIGFKQVGKSSLGPLLAQSLHRPYFDLDQAIEQQFKIHYAKSLSCRDIMRQQGEAYFRILENQALTQLLQHPKPMVLALGGGAPIEEENQKLIQSAIVIHVTADQTEILNRIINTGKPAFIQESSDLLSSLTDLWTQRMPIYNKLATHTIINNGTLQEACDQVLKALKPKKILLLHGPNLNRLGQRDPAHYGVLTLADLETLTLDRAKRQGIELITYQSNHEGDLIDTLQKFASECLGIMINAGALTHYSYALYDALLDTQLPVVEVHLSKIEEREAFRRHSVIAPACIQSISGRGAQGYLDAVDYLMEYLHVKHKSTH